MDDLLPRDFSTRLQNKSTPLSALKKGSSGSRSTSTCSTNPGTSNDDLSGLKGPYRTSSLSSISMPVYDDDVFGSLFGSGSMSGHVADDDLLGGEAESYGGFDDLIYGFRGQPERAAKTVSSSEDPFAVFETSSTTNPSVFDTLDNLGKTTTSTTNPSVFDTLDNLGKTTSSTTNPSVFDTLDNLGKTNIHSPESSTSSYETNATSSDLFSKKYSHLRTTDEAFFTIDEIPLFTKPSKAPPSLRPPPPPGTKLESYGNNNLSSKVKEQYSQTSASDFNRNGSIREESVSQIDELEEFARSKPRSNGDDLVTKKTSERKEKLDRDREAREKERNKLEKEREMENRKNKQYTEWVNAGEKASAGSQQHRHTNSGDIFFTQTQSNGSANATWQASSQTNFMDDLIFGFGGSALGEEFQEVEGESEDRRRARLERHQRTHERTKQALAEKQERDMQTQMEQEEKHRINETLDTEIRSWAAGKEGNLRALLSTLQYVLWPECGWQPVSLTDLITSSAVKKVYRKATLNLHPDKLHRANLQQKCIGEKVFDILKEAYNKFNSEEL